MHYYYYYYYYCVNSFLSCCICRSNIHCPSARRAYAANVKGKDLEIFAVGAASLIHILQSSV
jgi:hypothetical protein